MKSNLAINNVSLTRFVEKNDKKLAIRFSMNNLAKSGKILNIPLFLIEYMNNFIEV